DRLRRHPAIWHRHAPPTDTLSTGFAALDAVLPDGGWPMHALTEIVAPREGGGELRLALPALATLATRGRWLAWVGPPYVPYAPALAAAGVVLERLLWIRSVSPAEQLWSAEQALRSGACGAVLVWPSRAQPRGLRRLQLAAEDGRAWALVFRGEAPPGEATPASLRLRVAPSARGLAVEVQKCRGRSGARLEILLDD
ncbi:MAG: translesion DNA synthesis-associated protein ImuA, partial [Gammaproteobacteria bacterium]|nr:translesion DNA synthesis-associated protein ImuA [Gammaproteobacteria bacterium]